MQATSTPATAGPTKKRHAFHAWPHRPHTTAVCRTCCVELAAEFAADELRTIEKLTASEPEIVDTSEGLPF